MKKLMIILLTGIFLISSGYFAHAAEWITRVETSGEVFNPREPINAYVFVDNLSDEEQVIDLIGVTYEVFKWTEEGLEYQGAIALGQHLYFEINPHSSSRNAFVTAVNLDKYISGPGRYVVKAELHLIGVSPSEEYTYAHTNFTIKRRRTTTE